MKCLLTVVIFALSICLIPGCAVIKSKPIALEKQPAKTYHDKEDIQNRNTSYVQENKVLYFFANWSAAYND